MDDTLGIQPFGFFSLDALRAGWYLIWRQLIRVVPAALGVVLVSALMAWLGLGILMPILAGAGLLAVTIWAAVLVPRLTIQWAEQWYGATLTGPVAIWWGVSWRAFVAALVAAVILTPPQFVATSLSTSYPGSALGLLGGLLTVLLGLVNMVVSVLATGWAMSKVATIQIGTFTARTMTVPVPEAPPLPLTPAVVSGPAAPSLAAEPDGLPVAVATAPARAATAVAAPPRPAPRPVAVSDKRQCPKCGLYETELGKVIGWYCRICGWRGGKGR